MKPEIIALLTLISVQAVTPLDCFECDYTNYLDCFNKVSCRPTLREHVACYKFVVKDSLRNEQHKKGCTKYIEYPDEVCGFWRDQAKAEQQHDIVGCFTCEYDSCNSAGKLGQAFLFVALINVLYLLF